METLARQSRLGPFGSYTTPDDAETTDSYNAMNSPAPNGNAWANKPWANGTPTNTLVSSQRDTSRPRSSQPWQPLSSNTSSSPAIDTRPEAHSKAASTVLESSSAKGWNRRNNWPSVEASTSSAQRTRYGEQTRFFTPNNHMAQPGEPFLPLGTQPGPLRNVGHRTSDSSVNPLTHEDGNLTSSKSATDFASLVHEKENRVSSHQAIGSWADSSNLPSPVDDRRSNYGSDQYGSASASYKGSLPPSRSGFEPYGPGADVWNRSQRGSATPHVHSSSFTSTDAASSRVKSLNSLTPGTPSLDFDLGFDKLRISPHDNQNYPDGRRGSAYNPYQGYENASANIPSLMINDTAPTQVLDADRFEDAMGSTMVDDRPVGQSEDNYGYYRGHVTSSSASAHALRRLYGSNDLVPGAPSNGALDAHGSRAYSPEVSSSQQSSSTARQPNEPRKYHNDPYFNPHLQQFLAAHIRMQYGNQLPYGIQPDLQLTGLSGYNPISLVSPAGLPSVSAPRKPRDTEGGQSLRSALLEEFKKDPKNSKRYELKDIFDHIVEFSGDQHGSRFIQHKLETANSEEKERAFRELQQNAIQLMTDVFGNYVVQKFFEHGDQNQKKILANKMKGQVLNLSIQVYGCRVVQKAIDYVLVEQQAELVKELDGHILRCVKDQNGNHVIQKAIERVPMEHIRFIIDAFNGQIQHLATHAYGCRVVQRLLERCGPADKSRVLGELHACGPALIADQYGNYVTQHIIEHGSIEDRAKIMKLVRAQLIPFSKQKFASNVVEKSLTCGTEEERRAIMLQICEKNERGESPLQSLIKDAFGNYVIQRLFETLSAEDHAYFVSIVEPEVMRAKRLAPSKHAEALCTRLANNWANRAAQNRVYPTR